MSFRVDPPLTYSEIVIETFDHYRWLSKDLLHPTLTSSVPYNQQRIIRWSAAAALGWVRSALQTCAWMSHTHRCSTDRLISCLTETQTQRLRHVQRYTILQGTIWQNRFDKSFHLSSTTRTLKNDRPLTMASEFTCVKSISTAKVCVVRTKSAPKTQFRWIGSAKKCLSGVYCQYRMIFPLSFPCLRTKHTN